MLTSSELHAQPKRNAKTGASEPTLETGTQEVVTAVDEEGDFAMPPDQVMEDEKGDKLTLEKRVAKREVVEAAKRQRPDLFWGRSCSK